MLSPIFESFYENRSRTTFVDRCINLYPEQVVGEKGPEIGLLFNAPGIGAALATLGAGPIRGMAVGADNLLYVVSGSVFYSINAAWTATARGSLTTSTGPVKIIDNPTQVLVVDGVKGWCWEKVAATWTQVIPDGVTDLDTPSVAVYQDGFGLVNRAGTNEVGQSNYNDLSVYASGAGPTVNNYYVQGNPQPVLAMAELKQEVWCFKQKAIQVLVNQGSAGFAFVELPGVYIDVGIVAPTSVARLGESLAWLGSDDQGEGNVYLSMGYQAKPITPPSLAEHFKSLGTIADAIGYSYRANAHQFYVLTFPAGNETWAYDLLTNKWAQRGAWSGGKFVRERANCYAFFNRTHVVGDFENGNLYPMADTTYTDNGAARKWLRSWRVLPAKIPKSKEFSIDSLQVMLETGITVPAGDNPQLMLRVSYDGGANWIGPFDVALGKIGETSWRAIKNRLGSTSLRKGMDPVFEISSVDPMGIRITGAEIEGGP